MELKIDKRFQTGHTAAKCWEIITDIPRFVRCLPGASITEQKNDTDYTGQMTVKMGPMNLTFKGDAVVTKIDAESKTMHLTGSASDAKSGAATKMDLAISLEGEDDCAFVCNTTLDIGGKIVQYGSRLIQSATNSIFDKFVDNYKLMLNNAEDQIKTKLGAGSLLKGMVAGALKK